VIAGGVNIHPAVIENVLIAMAGVRDCAVFGIADEFAERLYVEPEAGACLLRAATASSRRSGGRSASGS
jgi:long-chain acyl-CoA synthetase